MYNYHCHTQYCDGASTAEEMVLAAIEAGFPALGFSSHAPVPFETDWTMPAEKSQLYVDELKFLKEKYSDKIQIYSGLEVDHLKGEQNITDDRIQAFNSDYLIGSIHFMGRLLVDNERWTIDNGSQEFKAGLDQMYGGNIKRLVRDFVELSAAMMEQGGFDIIGHIDKIYQHGCEYFSYEDAWYRKEMMSLFELAKAKDYIVEINTKHHHVLDMFFPHQSFFKAIKQLDIPIQVNSDCHQKERMTAAYSEAYALLQSVGYSEQRVLLDGKWQDRPF